MTDTAKTEKKIKAKGPIRWEALIPFLIVAALTGAYFHFFFDTHLRLGLQWGLSTAIGAEANVGDVKTSFWNAHLRIREIELTDAETPTQNSLSIGEIRFGMLWDALLRAKIVINEAVVEKIEFAKPRKKKGWVKPPEPPPVDDGRPSKLAQEADKLKGQALEKVQDQYSDNVFGDLAAVLGGADSQAQLGKIEESLASKKMAQELEARIKAKQNEWQTRIKGLPQGSEFQALGDRLSKIQTKDFKTPQELEKSLREFDEVFKEADAKIKIVQKAGDDLEADLKSLDQDLKNLEAQIKADIKKLELHFKIPQFDAKALTLGLFRQYVDPYLRKFQTYRALAEKYVPPNLMKKGSGDPDPAIQPRPRANGISYEFGRPNSYPFFWLKRTAISSQAGMSAYAGNIKGEILDLTSNQVIINRPTLVRVEGDFPASQILGMKTNLMVDNRKAESLIELLFALSSYPVNGKTLVQNQDVKIGFAKATGGLDVKASLKGLKDLDLKLDSRFSQLAYDVSAKDSQLDTLLKNIFQAVSVVTVDGRLSGILPRISLDLNSNLGPELRRGLEREVNAKIAEARAKIEKYVQDEVGKTKAQIDKELAQLKAQAEKEIAKLRAQADSQKKKAEEQANQAKKDAENQAEKAKKDAEDQARRKVEEEAKKAAEQLKKRLGL